MLMPFENKYLPFALVYLFIQNIILLIINIVTLVLGFIAVPIGLLFLQDGKSVSDGRPIKNLPKWLWLWGNDADGSDGDNRLWWDKNADEQVLFGLFPFLRKKGINVPTLNSKNYLSRLWWMAIRNPANNLRFVPYISCPVKECNVTFFGQYEVKDKLGKEGWQLVIAKHKKKDMIWMGLYWVIKYPNSNLGLRMRFGYKVQPKDYIDPSKLTLGFAISVIPNKDLT